MVEHWFGSCEAIGSVSAIAHTERKGRKEKGKETVLMVHTPVIQQEAEAEAESLLRVQAQSGLQSKRHFLKRQCIVPKKDYTFENLKL